MSERSCSVCGSWFSMSRTNSKLLGSGTNVFCSIDCMVKLIIQSKGLDTKLLERKGIIRRRNGASCVGFDPLCYSVKLNCSFRSYFEILVAETLVLSRGLECCYEPYDIPMHFGYNDRVYVPDFFLPEYGVFIEVKGEWLHGGRKKFRSALDIFGQDRMLLLGSYTLKAFRREVLTLDGCSIHKDTKSVSSN